MPAGFEVNTERIIHETLAGEVVAIDLGSGTYYSMKGTAETIWTGLVAGASVDTLARRVAASFDTAGTDPKPAILRFLEELQTGGLIVASETTSSEEQLVEPAPDAADLPAFEDPVLASFTDMQDLILLDPVHDVNPGMGWPHPVDDGRENG